MSGIVAITLSPMMCAKLLVEHRYNNKQHKFEKWLDQKFNKLESVYKRYLHGALNNKQVILVFSLIILVSCYFLFINSAKELEPKEDQGIILLMAEADPYVTLEYLEKYTKDINRIVEGITEIEKVFLINGIGGGGGFVSTNNAFGGLVLKPFTERKRSTYEVQKELQAKLPNIAGLKIAVFVPPSLPTAGGGMPVEFIINSTDSVENLQEFADDIIQQASQSKKFIFLNTDLNINKPRYTIEINRKKAAALGITMQDISRDLTIMLSGWSENRFSLKNRSYKVIPQVQKLDRFTPEQLNQYYTRTSSGKLIPLSTVISLKESVSQNNCKGFNNSIVLLFLEYLAMVLLLARLLNY